MKGGKRGTPIVAGKSAESLLFKLCSPADEADHAAQERGAADAAGAGAHQALDRPGGQAADGHGPRKAEDRRQPAAGDRQAGAGRRRQPRRQGRRRPAAATRSTSTKPTAASSSRRSSTRTSRRRTARPAKAAHLSLVESLAFSPDGKTLATGSFQEVKLWDAETGTLKQTHRRLRRPRRGPRLLARRQVLATGGGAPTEDGEIKIFDVGRQAGHRHQERPLATRSSASLQPGRQDARHLRRGQVRQGLGGARRGKFVKSFEGHTHHVLDVGWKPDGKLLASGGADNAVKVWDYEKGEQVRDHPTPHRSR